MYKYLRFLIFFTLTLSSYICWGQSAVEPRQDVINPNLQSQPEAIKLLSRYLQIPSLSGAEKDAGLFLSNYCKEQGLYVTKLSSDSAGFNFAATIYPLSVDKPVIWLQHHIDVVPANTMEEWRFLPYSGHVHNDTIWGRGAIDNKGQGIMQLMALLNMKKAADTTEFIYNMGILAFSSEEAGGGLGAKMVLKEDLKELKPLVVFGEGGAGLKKVLQSDPQRPVVGISVAEKRVLWLRLNLELNSFGHGAAPAPEYANKLMIHALSRLESRKFDMEFNRVNKRMFRRLGRAEGGIRGFVIRHINWWVLRPIVKKVVQQDPLLEALTTNTITVTKLENPPGPPNKISTITTAYLDCRLQPNTTSKAFIRKIERLLDEPKINIEVINTSPEAKPTPTNDFYDAFEWAVRKEIPEAAVIPILFPATTDNSYFRYYDIPTYGLMPAIISESLIKSVHSINERIPVAGVKQGINIYTHMLLRLESEGAQKRKRLLNAELRKINLLEE